MEKDKFNFICTKFPKEMRLKISQMIEAYVPSELRKVVGL